MPASIISYFVSSKDKHAIDLVLDFVTPMTRDNQKRIFDYHNMTEYKNQHYLLLF